VGGRIDDIGALTRVLKHCIGEVVDKIRIEGFALAATYIETESGGEDNRPELNKALAEAKRLKCPLMVSKLDRLSRDAGNTLMVELSPALAGLFRAGCVGFPT
jgi:hypothetical protein